MNNLEGGFRTYAEMIIVDEEYSMQGPKGDGFSLPIRNDINKAKLMEELLMLTQPSRLNA